MIKQIIQTLALRATALSLFSIAISLLGIFGIVYYAPSVFSALSRNPTDTLLQFQAVGLLVLLFIAIRSIFGDLLNITDTQPNIEVGTSIADSPYNFWRLFDDKCQDIFIIGQNLRTLLAEPKVLDRLRQMLHNNKELHVTIILTVPAAMNIIDTVAGSEFAQTVQQLSSFFCDLDNHSRQRTFIRFHPGATSLSAFIRDPQSRRRGLLVFTPKWATDREPGNRIYCVIRKWQNPTIFNKMFGHIGIMTGQRALTLQAVAKESGIRFPDLSENERPAIETTTLKSNRESQRAMKANRKLQD